MNGPFLFLGDGFRFDTWLDLSVYEVLNVGVNFCLGDLLVLRVGVFLVVGGVLDGEGGPFVDFEIQISCVRSERFGVNGSEADYPFVFLGYLPQFFCEFGSFFWSFCEDVGKWDASLRN